MRILADENVDFAIVRALREAGHDVRALAEETTRTVDSEVIRLARDEARVLVTEDKDFGWLSFVALAGGAVVLVRFPARARRAAIVAVVDAFSRHEEALVASFVVVAPGQVRITRLPSGE